MCGRVTLTLDKQTVLDILGDVLQVSNQPELQELPNYNIGPAQPMLSVIRHNDQQRAGYLRWGFVPSHAKDESIGYSLINTRSEGINTKPTFIDSFAHKRCILIADSFFEWKKEKEKIPYRFILKNQQLMTFPGLYSTFTRKNGEKIHTCSVITCAANQIMAPIHHRMPVILTYEDSLRWLHESTQVSELLELLKPISEELIECYEVSSIVNSLKNNTIRCIEPAEKQMKLN